MTHLLKIGPRLFANLALTLALFAFVSVTFLNDVAEETEKAETAELLALLEITQSVLADFDSQVTDNTLTLQEAQTRAQQLLNSLRYAETNYFFAFDGDLNVISHGANNTLIGRNMSDVADPNGALVFAGFREAAQNGNGLLEYEWPKPGSDTPVAKLGAAVYFEPWGWYVGTGIYRDHLQAVVAHERSVILWLTIPIGIILLVVATIITYSITSPIKKLQKRMNELAQGDDTSPVPATKAGGELGAMAKAIADFCETHQRAGEATRAEIARRASDQQAQQAVVAELGSKLHALSKGDMRQRIETVFEAEYDVLRDDFNAAIDQMNKALSSVVLRAAGINDRTSEISNATDSLSVRTESQAATLEQTSAAVQDFTSHVGATAESAENANGYVKKTRQHAEINRKVVSDTEEAMESISKSSGEISKIIQVIDDIAFQTNLLALNAGVEAARAGDAGRGFGVVADEVRALARRSSEAAKEINLLISNSSENVEKGVKLVGRTGKALADIIEMVTEISGLVAGIAKSCQEQTMSLGDINIAVSQLDEVTQSNAAMAEQTNAAGRLLAQDAQSLSALTGQFNLADTSEETSHETNQAA